MDRKGGPQSSEETKEEKKNPSPTKPNNGQNSPTHSAGPSTPSNSKKQEPSKGDGGRKTKTASEAAGLCTKRKSLPGTDKKQGAASLSQTVRGTKTPKSPKLTEETEEEKKNRPLTKPNNGQNSPTHSAGPSTPSNSNKQEPSKGDGGRKTKTASEVAGLCPNHPVIVKEPTKSHESAVDAAGIGKKRQDTR